MLPSGTAFGDSNRPLLRVVPVAHSPQWPADAIPPRIGADDDSMSDHGAAVADRDGGRRGRVDLSALRGSRGGRLRLLRRGSANGVRMSDLPRVHLARRRVVGASPPHLSRANDLRENLKSQRVREAREQRRVSTARSCPSRTSACAEQHENAPEQADGKAHRAG